MKSLELLIKTLELKGLIENIDFRVVHFGTSYEIKYLTK